MKKSHFIYFDADGKPLAEGATGHAYVRDTRTGLEWGMPFPERMTQADAEKACAEHALAGGGWRLPLVQGELPTIVDYSASNPAIDTDAFPDTPPGAFWSSSPFVPHPVDYAWIVDFDGGDVDAGYRVSRAWARPVRGPFPAGQ